MKGVLILGITFKKNGDMIVYPKGMSNDEAILYLENRIKRRDKQLLKRQWIVDEYNTLLSKQKLDREWITILRTNQVVLGSD